MSEMGVVLLLVLLALALSTAKACSCSRDPFCVKTESAKLIISGTVLNESSSQTMHLYEVDVDTVFKGTLADEHTLIRSPLEESLCGISLQVGGKYMIAGSADGFINLCGPTKPWSDLTPEETHIVSTYNGFCSPCLKVCPVDVNPVCGSDGKTYKNGCLLSNEACNSLGLTKKHDGACCSKACGASQECRSGPDGEYCVGVCNDDTCESGYECELEVVQCFKAPCPSIPVCKPVCEDKICPHRFAPVCASDGRSYSNECTLRMAQCTDPTLTKVLDGKCPLDKETIGPCPANPVLSAKYEPICSSDGETYTNMGWFEAARCRNPQLEIVHRGVCKQHSCESGCEEIYKPVCSNQGITYDNMCMLNQAACKDPNIWFDRNGECEPCA